MSLIFFLSEMDNFVNILSHSLHSFSSINYITGVFVVFTPGNKHLVLFEPEQVLLELGHSRCLNYGHHSLGPVLLLNCLRHFPAKLLPIYLQ